MKIYSNITVKKLPKSIIQIEGEIGADVLKDKQKKALKKITEQTELDGFRKGKAPEDLIIKRFGEMAILEEAAELALADAYPEILLENKIDAIGRPKVSILKLAIGNPMSFRIETATVPSITLGDYKKVAKKTTSGKIDSEVSDKEVAETIEKIQESRNKKGEALTDESVKELGPFTDVENFKKKLKENMVTEKTRLGMEKKRVALMDELIKQTKIDLPEILVEAELDRMLGTLEHDLSHSGVKFEDYLKQIKKTVEEIRKEWQEPADKKARFQLILNEIAKAENIKPKEDQVQKEIEHYKTHYPEANEERLRVYVESMLSNSEVMEWLEGQGKE